MLYIEDDEVNRLLMQAYLGLRPDLDLETADDGTTGVAAALAGVPDLLLIDMMLPDIDGIEVLAALRADAALGAVPCVAVSANALPEQITEALAAGFDDYLTKPLSAAGLLLAIDRWLAAGRLRAADGAGCPPTITAPEERCDSARNAAAAGGSGAARLGADRATALARPEPRVRREPSAPAVPGRARRRPACCRLHESSLS